MELYNYKLLFKKDKLLADFSPNHNGAKNKGN